MTTYTAITNAEIDPESPVTESLVQRLRDNPIAISEGEPNAPKINPAAISIGGKGADGVLNNATVFSNPGFYDFEGGAIRSAALALPVASIIRINGDFTLSATATVSKRSLTVGTNTTEKAQISDLMDAKFGADGGDNGVTIGYGGNAFGLGGGPSLGPANGSPSTVAKYWITRRLYLGGNGGLTSGGGGGTEWGPGGGALLLLVDGDFIATGGTILANGSETNDLGAGPNNPGGGGGGSIVVICTGTITGGTFRAEGGISNYGGSGTGGAGGGGLVQLIASAFSGSQTITVNGGSGFVAGAAGYSNSLTLDADYIRTLLQRL